MKKSLLTFMLSLCFFMGFGQDTLAQEEQLDPDYELVNNYHYLRSNKEEVRAMLFIGTEGGFEARLFHRFSVRATSDILTLSPYLNGSDFITERNMLFVGGSASMRYYPFKALNTSNKTNLSGLSVGIGVNGHFGIRGYLTEVNQTSNNVKTGAANGNYLDVTYQKRIFKNGYYNIGLRLANMTSREIIVDEINDDVRVGRSINKLYLIPSLNFGFAFYKRKGADAYLNYTTEKQSFMKLNISNLFFYFGGNSVLGTYERKVGSSHTSLLGSMRLGVGKDKIPFEDNVDVYKKDQKSVFGALSGELRNYYNYESRRQARKVGNGFSANYIAMNLSYYSSRYANTEIATQVQKTSFNHTIAPSVFWGIQRDLGEHLYFDLGLGLNIVTFRKNSNNDWKTSFATPLVRLDFGFAR